MTQRFLMLGRLPILLVILSLPLAHAAEMAKPVFDNRKWELAWSQNPGAAGTGSTVFDEYVLKGENVDHWSELVTIQFFPGLNKDVTLEVFEAQNKWGLVQICPTIQWQSLSQSQNERMWAWAAKDCPGVENQSEIARVVKTNEGIHMFHYAIKKSPMPAPVEKIWTQNLKTISIK